MYTPASDSVLPSEPDIVIKALTVTYGDAEGQVIALDDLDLTVRSGEFLSIMGPSGCGKTTLLNVIAGFVHPSAGSVTIYGDPITGPGPDRAVVFQDDAVFPWMSVERNIGFSHEVAGKSKAEIRNVTERYLALIGLEEFREVWPSQLSGGMRKRVDLARGYAAKPRVLLLDEPFGALDIMTKELLQEELHGLWMADPRTIVMVTHDIEEALFLGDRIVVMTDRPGKIAGIYEPAFPKPRNLDIRTADDFVDLRRELRALIHDMRLTE